MVYVFQTCKYDADQLVNMLCLSSGENFSAWMQLEDACSYVIPLLDVIWQSKCARPIRLAELDSVFTMLHVWDQYRIKLVQKISLLTFLLNQSWFPLANSSSVFNYWHSQFFHLMDFVSEGKLLEKEALET